ncbi:sugar ABC transporter permease [Flexivirga sp. ID2601S]|uniref:Sugar ABC transporter permease n=1 Tax=Flexivirga aerilata TaxID=1656889 RepID=A0A849AHP1_9MICO|nr:sugar ABC transporter permease [Flexivirga aerilata]NNG38811.1 sugar ABC transporter permease [Flexivirga aerilata]
MTTSAPSRTQPSTTSKVGEKRVTATLSTQRRKERLLATVFLAPTVIGIFVFTVVPIVGSFLLAFFRWDIISSPRFVGLDNFTSLGTDRTLRVAFANTIAFVVVAVLLQLAVALALAVLVQGHLPTWLRSILRSVFFFPLILSAASVSIIMSYLFNQDFGLVNQVLTGVGLPDVPWLTSGPGAQLLVVLVYVWQNFGFSFLLFVGGLASIPRDVYEAAAIDGASGWRQFRQITFPLLSPTTLVASVMAVISALQIFDQPYVLTRGGPGDSTRTVVMVIYENAFQQLQFGRASAIGIVLTVFIMLATALQFRLSRRFIHYS